MAFVTGKGGTGKSTVSLALALAAARTGRPVVICEVGARGRRARAAPPGIRRVAIDPDDALREWLGRKVGRAAAALLARSEVLATLVAAAPGARELVTIGKAWDLGRRAPRPLVVVDAPSSGHALALLRAPATFAVVGGPGPVGREAGAVRDSLADPERTLLVAVAEPTELAVAETLQLDAGLHEVLGRGAGLLVVNRVLDDRFDAGERAALARALPRAAAGPPRRALRAALARDRRRAAQRAALAPLAALDAAARVALPLVLRERLGLADVQAFADQMSSGTISIAPAGHSRAQMPQPLQ
jgi:anion-transporting  ArsA/GET3 family ATPase